MLPRRSQVPRLLIQRPRLPRLSSGLGCAALLLVATLVSPHDARALRTHERPNWLLGVGMGYGRGSFEGPGISSGSYRNGAAPQIQLGRLLGQHAMVGLVYEGWIVEVGGVGPDTVGIKFRRSLQNLAIGVTLFPGNPHGPTGGIFLRVAGGVGWAGTAGSVVIEGTPQHNAKRVDEWGLGASAAAGYEFRIAPSFSLGLGLGFDWFDIGEEIVDSGKFGALLMHMNLYF